MRWINEGMTAEDRMYFLSYKDFDNYATNSLSEFLSGIKTKPLSIVELSDKLTQMPEFEKRSLVIFESIPDPSMDYVKTTKYSPCEVDEKFLNDRLHEYFKRHKMEPVQTSDMPVDSNEPNTVWIRSERWRVRDGKICGNGKELRFNQLTDRELKSVTRIQSNGYEDKVFREKEKFNAAIFIGIIVVFLMALASCS